MALHLLSCVRTRANASRLTAKELRKIMTYDPQTGLWKRHEKFVGGRSKVGTLMPNGYIKICIGYKQYYSHVLAWLYMTGEWPPKGMEVDHIDTDNPNNRSDNRWTNLRLGTCRQNKWNRGKPSNNTSGYLCVFWHEQGGRWWARVGDKSLGLYDTREEAYEVVRKYMLTTRGEFAHHSLKS